jgi:crotonobetainyl-CoA:carnitine CoA-transferase CaiB-like acyl-CoA transferase
MEARTHSLEIPPGLLAGLRVLDLCDESGALAGKILADLGADVVAVEPPGGNRALRRAPYLPGPGAEASTDPERSLAWLALQAGKRGIALDLTSEAGRARYLRLLASADVVIESFRPGHLAGLGLDYDDLAARFPRLVHCSITPFGRTGPRADWKGHDLVVVATGGNLAMTGEPDHPPVRCTMPTAYYHGGPEAVVGILAALYARNLHGRGQLVDVSLQETQLQSLITNASQHAFKPANARRAGARMGRTNEIWEARDGQVSFGLRGGRPRIPNLRATVELMHEHGMAPQWLRDYDWEHYSHLEASDEEIRRLEEAFGAFFASKSMGWLYREALARRILLAPCNDAREILEHEQLRSRGLFRRIDYPHLGVSIEHPDFFAKIEGAPVAIRRRAPSVGEHDAEVDAEWGERAAPGTTPAAPIEPKARSKGAGVFEGLKVLEIGSGAAGPLATKYLAEHGARVVRVESSRSPDFLRTLFLTRDSKFGVDGSPMFVLLNPNKQSLTLNLKHPEAGELARELVAWADVLCENYAPGVMERFGLDAKKAREINPRLVYASGCLFGQTGPQRHYPGYGGQGSAISGFNHLTGRPDGPAHGPFATITDSLSPRYVALAIEAALLRRQRTGEGCTIDVSQIEAAVYSQSEVVVRYSATGEVVTRDANRDPNALLHGVYPCAGEDRWIAIAAWTPEELEALSKELGAPPDDAGVAAWTRGQDALKLAETLQGRGIEAGGVARFQDLLDDPQLAHRGHWVPIAHSNLGELLFERSGFRLSEGSGGFTSPGPNLGEHTREALEALGIRREDAPLEALE